MHDIICMRRSTGWPREMERDTSASCIDTSASCVEQVMAANGVSHQVVADDLEGVRAVLCWLSFVPPVLGGPLPSLATRDPADRPVTVSPAQGGR